MDEGHARIKMDEVKRHIDRTWFAWIGGRRRQERLLLPRAQPGAIDRVRSSAPGQPAAVCQGPVHAHAPAHPLRGAHAQRQRLRQGSAASALSRASPRLTAPLWTISSFVLRCHPERAKRFSSRRGICFLLLFCAVVLSAVSARESPFAVVPVVGDAILVSSHRLIFTSDSPSALTALVIPKRAVFSESRDLSSCAASRRGFRPRTPSMHIPRCVFQSGTDRSSQSRGLASFLLLSFAPSF